MSIVSARLATARRASVLAALLAAVPLAAQAPAPPAAAAASAPIPRYDVKRAPSPVTVDGKLDDAAWAVASAPVTLQFLWDDQTGAKQKTLVRVLWDNQALYLGYEADDADINARFENRDDPTYQDDAVEVFINPDPRQSNQQVHYFGFEMSVKGVVYDYLNYNGRTFFAPWDAKGLKVATSVRGTMNVRTDTDEGWTLEAAIPWSNFQPLARRPAPGAVWRVNFNRWDGVNPARRMSIWSDPQNTTSWPHVPERFGELAFVE